MNPDLVGPDFIWTIEILSESKARLKDSKGIYIAPKNGDNNLLIQGKFDWDLVANDDGTISFSAPNSDPHVTLAANMTANQTYTGHFRAYKNSTIELSSKTYPTRFTLYQVSNSIDLTEAPPVCIYEAYGGGGNSGATWRNDYVILKSTSDQTISLDAWHLFYYSEKGEFTVITKTALSGTIAAKGYYLIQQAKGSGGNKNRTNLGVPGT